ncbi:two-component sensor histidine kinase [Pseudomonas sp. SWI6]|uniref:histidine kinase n=1 Tax=Pseudomonas taiwanensis TaxID=470150 RepID=A0ABR6V3P2_9PSED|nr:MULTISPECIES: ATP-binding protein [Pseudomonas]AVD82999.1 two-component sensor histidine kinase [Pseudomonas sp. SWI6]MBC3474502.1 sensor histidine kinase N-terminal domain-containing protein [Pseudomonas taiwanensis]MBC3489565.1 sensor histidine kinase N-terminal domain-containing protein [Pseudomonas taiwanensis]MPT00166.1 two-component sensor histidine kinase [Pseudomonas sp.]WEZ86574.1 ATP-binding protein [Pseudomonas sp. NyZ480]
MSSLRQRTLWRVMLSLLVGSGALALYNYHDSRHEINEVYDAHLAQNARLLQGIMSLPVQEQSRDALYRAFNEALSKAGHHRVGHPYESKLAFQVWSDDGSLLVHTPSAPRIEPAPRTPGFADIVVAEQRWRSFMLPVPEKRWVIWVGERNDVRYDLIDRIVRHTLMPFLLGSLVLALLVWAAIGWGLKPLQNMATVIRARHAESLEPLQLVPLPAELEPMQAAINRLLAQIDEMLRREHRFIADAAHEMRTPLAILRLHAQNALAAASEAERQKALTYLIGGVDRLARVVNQLLTLARLEPQLGPRDWQPVDLAEVVTDTLADLTPWMLARGLEPSLDIAEADYRVSADAGALGIAIQNLVTNAADHSPAGGRVSVRLRREGQTVRLDVDDEGPGIEPVNLKRVFERFYSKDAPNGAGLGLSIVAAIMSRVGGSVQLDNRAPHGLRATLRLPTKS